MRILGVCTANICRSASAERLLRDAVDERPELAGLEVRSAGTYAAEGMPGCAMAPALDGRDTEHRSQPLTPELVEWADVILTAARDHRAAVVTMLPSARTRTFTLRQAGRIVAWLEQSGMLEAARERAADPEGWERRHPSGDSRQHVLPLPEDPRRRGPWLVKEMDVARSAVSAVGLDVAAEDDGGIGAAAGGEGAGRGRWRGLGRRRGRSHQDDPPEWMHPDDVPDPHVHGMGLHSVAYESIVEATGAITAMLQRVEAD